jgi:hypothetical protein
MKMRTGIKTPKVKQSPSIKNLATPVVDTGRRGAPRPSCDCVQCFGYCIIDPEAARRSLFALAPSRVDETVELDFRRDFIP